MAHLFGDTIAKEDFDKLQSDKEVLTLINESDPNIMFGGVSKTEKKVKLNNGLSMRKQRKVLKADCENTDPKS